MVKKRKIYIISIYFVTNKKLQSRKAELNSIWYAKPFFKRKFERLRFSKKSFVREPNLSRLW